MRQEYQKQFKTEVDLLAASGFEMFFLCGQALRDLGSNQAVAKQYAMPAELRIAVKEACQGFSLELSPFSAANLNDRVEREESSAKATRSMKQLTNHDH